MSEIGARNESLLELSGTLIATRRAARPEDLQTQPRKTPVIGNDFVQLISSQIDTWRAVERAANVEVIT